MSEAKILQAIADKVKDDRLHFQVIIQDNAAHIYINRDTEDYIDHRELAESIQSAISALDELNLIEIGLYSRILGEVEPDWQTFVEFAQEAASIELAADEIVDEASNTDSSTVEVEPEFEIEQEVVSDASLDSEQIEESTESKATETISDSEQPQDLSENKSLERSQISTAENKDASNSKNSIDLDKESIEDKPAALDLSQYCFIRNKRLLNADLVVPQEKIAQIIDTFHNFDKSIKRSQLPILESYFKDGTAPDTNDFASDIETWWAGIQELEANVKRKLAIWLSRYCLDPVATIATVESVFEAKAAAKKAVEETARQEKKAQNTSYNNNYSSNSSQAKQSLDRQQTDSESTKSTSRFGSWTTYLLVVFIIRLVGRGFLNLFNFAAINQPIGVNEEILKEYGQEELDKAKRLSDLSLRKYKKRDFNAAWKYTTQSLEVFPDYARAYYNRGTLKEKRQDVEGAIEDYTQAIEMYPDNVSTANILHQAYNNRGLLFRKLGYHLDAIDDATQAIALAPDDGGYYANRGLAYSGMRDYESALKDQTRAIELEPNHPGWHFNRGRVYIHMGNYQKALTDLDKAISLNPSLARAYAFRCYTYEALGNFINARADRRKAESLGYKF